MSEDREDDDKELRITSLYVLKRLEEHLKECSRRWWSVMCAEGAIILLLVGIIFQRVFSQ